MNDAITDPAKSPALMSSPRGLVGIWNPSPLQPSNAVSSTPAIADVATTLRRLTS
jgi:hypothetical protein